MTTQTPSLIVHSRMFWLDNVPQINLLVSLFNEKELLLILKLLVIIKIGNNIKGQTVKPFKRRFGPSN